MIYKNKKGDEVEFDVDSFPFSTTIKHEIKGLTYQSLCEFEDWCIDALDGDEILGVNDINDYIEEHIDEFHLDDVDMEEEW